ncbi:FHA domain-containing protein [Desulfococcaceae bacterium HSG7]|nr:FHA domain-containing protein [Desulfococcaceae bacterium HSG7]
MLAESEDKTAVDHDKTVFYKRTASSKQDNRITVIEGEPRGKVCLFGDSIVIGRGSTCRLTIENDPYVSREHVRIERKGKKKYRLINLEKKNTTLLNGKEIAKPALIKSGDKVKIGDTTLKIDLGGSKTVVRNTRVTSVKTKMVLYILAVLIILILVMQMIPKPSSDIQMHLERGNRFLIENKYKEAKHEFKLVLDEDDKNREAKDRLKECNEKIRKQNERNKIERYLAKGHNCYKNGDYHYALEAFENVLKLDKKNLIAIQKLRECKATIKEKDKKNVERIANWLNTAKELTDYLIANELTDLLTIKEADERLDKAENDVNKAISLCDQLGNVPEDGNRQKARRTLKDIQKIKKEINEQKQRLEEVFSLYEKAKNFSDRHEYYNALKVLEKLLEMNVLCRESISTRKLIPKIKQRLVAKVKSDYNQGRRYFKKKRYSKAIAYLHKVYQIYPEYKEIRRLYRDTINKLTLLAKKLIGKGLVYEGLNKVDAARQEWKKVLQIMPIESNELHQQAKRKLSKLKQ